MGKGDPRDIFKLKPIKPGGGRSRGHQPRGKGGKFGSGREEDVRQPVLTRRAKEMGWGKDKEARARASAPWLGEDLGRVMERLADDAEELRKLWGIWLGLCQAMRTYRHRILDKRAGPKGANFTMIHEKLETSADAPPSDARTEEERDEGARESHRRWMDRLDRLPTGMGHRSRLMQAESGSTRELWTGHAPSLAGSKTMEALRELAKVIERESR